MRRAVVLLAYAVLLIITLYIVVLHDDWHPDQSLVSTSRSLFLVFAVISLGCMAFATWWVPAGVLTIAVLTVPLISPAGFDLEYVVYGTIVVAITAGFGWTLRRPGPAANRRY